MTALRAFSYGGGVQSTAALVLAATGEIDFPLFLFANTGDDSEHPATLRYVREVAAPYAAANGIELVELDGSSTLLASLYRRQRSIHIPVRMSNGSPGNRGCTTDFKVRRIARELKRRGATPDEPATVGIGISVDEFHRMRTGNGIAWERLAYPLIDRRLDRAGCVATIERAGLPVPPKSSCWFCPYHSTADWRRLLAESPDLFAAAVALERTLNERRAALGKDAVYLSGKLQPLDHAITDTGQLDLFGAGCDAGYCMV